MDIIAKLAFIIAIVALIMASAAFKMAWSFWPTYRYVKREYESKYPYPSKEPE